MKDILGHLATSNFEMRDFSCKENSIPYAKSVYIHFTCYYTPMKTLGRNITEFKN